MKFGKLPAARKRKDRQRIGSADPSMLPPVPGTEARWRPGSADATAPEQVSQMAGLREFRLAESLQILPSAGNRKPASDRVHCPNGSNPLTAQPTGRRIGGR